VFVDDFATTSVDEWTHSGSGQWAFNGGTFAQNSVGAEARAVIGGKTQDQIVSARVRQFAWSTAGTAERWAGLLARYVDDNNYYYLHLRSGGTVSLRKLVNGTITTLASAPLAVSLNTQYTLRLEVVGNQLRGYVNGNLMLQATDSSHTAGISGLMTNKSATRFDDYVAYQP
jgi:pectate lyase